jgi:hypothetical protein
VITPLASRAVHNGARRPGAHKNGRRRAAVNVSNAAPASLIDPKSRRFGAPLLCDTPISASMANGIWLAAHFR